jgi:hypothetical protein
MLRRCDCALGTECCWCVTLYVTLFVLLQVASAPHPEELNREALFLCKMHHMLQLCYNLVTFSVFGAAAGGECSTS